MVLKHFNQNFYRKYTKKIDSKGKIFQNIIGKWIPRNQFKVNQNNKIAFRWLTVPIDWSNFGKVFHSWMKIDCSIHHYKIKKRRKHEKNIINVIYNDITKYNLIWYNVI